ncbi:hypothetical protein BKI52_11765 [marine bacterium AO1-C]|nr:hypothetical protein BKI52_11765 [marine bacterium AO1-C]
MSQTHHLFAKDFIKALQGQTVSDQAGSTVNFLKSNSQADSIPEIFVQNVEVIDAVQIQLSEEDSLVFPHPIVITDGVFHSKFHINAGEFNGFEISNTHFKRSLKIAGGFFKSNFKINSGTFGGVFGINAGIFNKDIQILGGAFLSEVKFSGGNFDSKIEIKGGNFDELFAIEEGDFKKGVYISGGVFKDTFDISGGKFGPNAAKEHTCFAIRGGDFNGLFKISGGSYKTKFGIKAGNFQEFRIKNGNFHQDFNILGGNFAKSFHIEKGVSFQEVNISNGTFRSKFEVSGGKFQASMNIKGGKFSDEFVIDDAEFHQELYFQAGSFAKEIVIKNTKAPRPIQNLTFALSAFIKTRVHIEQGAQIETLEFQEGIASGGAVYVDKIEVKNLLFRKFKNEGILELTGLPGKETSPNLLSLTSSNLDNAVFKGVKFDSFDKIIIHETKLNSISTVYDHFPVKKESLGTSINNRNEIEKDFNGMAENYNQLYLAMQKQGNRSKEMEYYSRYLYWQHKAALKDHQMSAWLSLSMHKWSNRFGQSWLQGVLCFFILSLLFYALYVIDPTLKSIKGIDCHQEVNSIEYHFKYYLQFLNPIRQNDLINCYKLTPAMIAIDFIWRIIAGYLTYQIITAFRRFGRK